MKYPFNGLAVFGSKGGVPGNTDAIMNVPPILQPTSLVPEGLKSPEVGTTNTRNTSFCASTTTTVTNAAQATPIILALGLGLWDIEVNWVANQNWAGAGGTYVVQWVGANSGFVAPLLNNTLPAIGIITGRSHHVMALTQEVWNVQVVVPASGAAQTNSLTVYIVGNRLG